MSRILYWKNENGVSTFSPNKNAFNNLSDDEIKDKFSPDGVKSSIINRSELPHEEKRRAWVILDESTMQISISLDKLKEIERSWRNNELRDYIDWFQSRAILYNSLTDGDRENLATYYDELTSYPEIDRFGDDSLRPKRPLSPIKPT